MEGQWHSRCRTDQTAWQCAVGGLAPVKRRGGCRWADAELRTGGAPYSTVSSAVLYMYRAYCTTVHVRQGRLNPSQ